MGSLFGNIARGIGGAVMTVARSPIAKAIPVVGTGLSVLGAASGAYNMLKPSPGQVPTGMPAMPGMPMGVSQYAGQTGIFQNDPNVKGRKDIEAAAISKANLKVCYRSPQRGYVVVRDDNGDPMAIPKAMAKQYYGWRPAKKPLLSIRDTNAIRRAGTAIKKLQRAEKMAKKIANWHSPHRSAPRNIIVTGGTVGRKRIAA